MSERKCMFTFKASSKALEIRYGRQVIARADANYGFHLLRDLALRPGGEALISFHQLAPHCFARVTLAPRVRATETGLELVLDVHSEDRVLHTTCAATVELSRGGKTFVWTFSHTTRVLRTVPFPERFFPRTEADPEFADTGAWVFEFTDPMPHRAFGPKDGPVPVDRPDILFPQAWFRKGGWQRNWTHFVFSRADGKLIRIPMNHLENHDKDFWRQSPDGFVAFVGGRGTNLRYRFLDGTGRNVAHHYCMWGYDIHFWELCAPGTGGHPNPPPKLKAGTRFQHRYVLEALSDPAAAQLLRRAADHPWRQGDQRTLDNTPAYKPGVNRFQAALRREDDRGFFQPAATADFLPDHPGRHTPGCVRLDNHLFAYDRKGKPASLYNAWVIGLGSDNWHTPIASGKRHEIKVWVKMEADASTVARIAMTYMVQHNQATPAWRVQTSKPCFSNEACGKTGWVLLRLITPALPKAYVSSMTIRLELLGRGLAYFDECECRQVD